MITVKNLNKSFLNTKAVNNVSFHIGEGELVGFMGPNGAGKSTTMRLLAGYLQPNSGSVEICGINMLKNPRQAQAKLGYLPEQGGLFGNLTVKEYLTFLGQAQSVPNLPVAINIAANATRCDAFINTPMPQLSKGQRQRAFFAGALIHNPDVLILDEPTDGLDPNQKHEMRLILKELAKTKAIILSTHILEEAEAVCSRVIILNQGEIVADNTPKELAKQGKGNIQIAFRVLTTFNPSQAGK